AKIAAVNRRRFLERTIAAPLAAAVAGCSGGSSATTAVRPPRRATLSDLRLAMRGPVLTPGEHGYAAAREVYNQRYDRIHPQAVALAATEQDVQTCVRWAGRAGSPLAARSGGHSYAGYSTTTGVVCDLRGLNAISIAADRRP